MGCFHGGGISLFRDWDIIGLSGSIYGENISSVPCLCRRYDESRGGYEIMLRCYQEDDFLDPIFPPSALATCAYSN